MLKCCFLSSILAIYRKASFRCFFAEFLSIFFFYFKANKPVFKTYKQNLILVHFLIKLVSSSLLHFSSRSLSCATIFCFVILLFTSFLVGDSLTLIFCCFYWIAGSSLSPKKLAEVSYGNFLDVLKIIATFLYCVFLIKILLFAL